jgi:predicted flap endonuclease-1-like 5' DNA nuclease
MKIIENNLTLLFIIIAMLFVAFLIGYFFGYYEINKKITLKFKNKNNIRNQSLKSPKSTATDTSEDINHIEISNTSTSGALRALRTRERIGKLSEEVKSKMADKTIDFTHIGFGNKSHRDDFTKIAGISSLVEEKLNTVRIYNYSQLCQMTDLDIRAITKVIEFFPGRIHRDDWKGQAKGLMRNNKKESDSI